MVYITYAQMTIMNKKLTFKMLCPEWDGKFKKEFLNADCVNEMNSHCACAVGEAFGLRDAITIADAHGTEEYTLPIDKRYFSSSSIASCYQCRNFSIAFD